VDGRANPFRRSPARRKAHPNMSIAATQLYIWSQVYHREGRDLEAGMAAVLDEVATAGYPAIEGNLTGCVTPERARCLRALLDERGLALTSLYSGGCYYEPERARQSLEELLPLAGRATEIGCPAICLNPDVRRERKTDDELRTQAEWLNRVGAALRELGLGLWLHNHDPEMRDGGRELRSNLDLTDPGLVGFCADTHWIYRGGGDVLAYLDRYGSRLGSLHLRNSTKGIWSETLGDGDLDCRAIAAKLAALKFDGPLIVELAIENGTPQTRPLVESMRTSREYLRAVFGV
jgi:inosose dehydratase